MLCFRFGNALELECSGDHSVVFQCYLKLIHELLLNYCTCFSRMIFSNGLQSEPILDGLQSSFIYSMIF